MVNRFEESGKDSNNFTMCKVVTVPIGAEIDLSGFVCTVIDVKGKKLILAPEGNVTFKKGKEFDVQEIIEEL